MHVRQEKDKKKEKEKKEWVHLLVLTPTLTLTLFITPSPNHLSKQLLWMTSPTVQSNEDELSLDWLHVHHFVIQNCHFDYPFAIWASGQWHAWTDHYKQLSQLHVCGTVCTSRNASNHDLKIKEASSSKLLFQRTYQLVFPWSHNSWEASLLISCISLLFRRPINLPFPGKQMVT